MDRRLLQLFKVLIVNNDYVATDYLCEVLGISPRTLRTEMNRLSDYLAETGTELEKRRNLGVRLIILDKEKLEVFKREIKQTDKYHQTNIPDTQEERIDFIIDSMLCTANYVRVNLLLEQMHVSKSTFHADFKLAKVHLLNSRIHIIKRGSGEIKLQGREQDIRSYIVAFSRLMTSLDYESETIAKVLYEVLKLHQYRLADYGFQRLIWYLTAAILRVRCGAVIQADETFRHEHEAEYRIAKALSASLERRFGLRLPEPESRWIADILIGNRTSINVGADIATDTVILVTHMIERINTVYGIDFASDSELLRTVGPHVQAMIERSHYGYFLENPMLLDIKIKYQLAYDMSFTAGEYISKHIGIQIEEGEFSFLALYFQLALERRRKRKKRRVLVVCSSNQGSSQLLLYRLKEAFAEYLEQIDVTPSYEVEKELEKGYDCIITTVPLKISAKIPILRIDYFLEDKSLTLIRKFFENNQSEYEFTLKCFEKSFIFDDISGSTKEEIIHGIISRVMPYRSLPAEFEELVLNRESIAPTEYGNMTALPHPTRICMNETFIAVAVLPIPICWVKTEVKIVIMLFVQKNVDSGVQLFNEILAKLILNRKSLNAIAETPKFSVLLHEITKLCSIQDLDMEQHFFR